MTRIKICGITELEHGLCALEAGADMLGFVFAPSRRRLSPQKAEAIVEGCRLRFPAGQRPWEAVGVFANQPRESVLASASLARLDAVQLSGRESDSFCRHMLLPLYRVVHVPELVVGERGDPMEDMLCIIKERSGAARLLLDSGRASRWGGTGETFRWEQIGEGARGCLVAGGLNPENVAESIAAMHPWGVDTSSGVENEGRKDPDLIRRFIREVRRIHE